MELIVIGSGSSGNGYLLQSSEGEILLIETGMPLSKVKKAIDFRVSNIVGALISHSHKDHSGRTMEYLTAGIRCHTSADTIKELGIISSHNFIPVNHKVVYYIGGFAVMPFDLVHDVRCFGYFIRHHECGSVVFITDTLYSKYTFCNLNHMIVEANYSDEILDQRLMEDLVWKVRNRIITSHMSFDTCMSFIKANDQRHLRNIVLIHLSSSNSNAGEFIDKIQKATGKKTYVAESGMKIQLNRSTPF